MPPNTVAALAVGEGVKAFGKLWDPLVNLGRGEHICVEHGALQPAPLFLVALPTLTASEERVYQELNKRRADDR